MIHMIQIGNPEIKNGMEVTVVLNRIRHEIKKISLLERPVV